MQIRHAVVGAALACGLMSAAANAASLVPGFDGSSIGRNDDFASEAIPIGFSANFFGSTYSSLYISNNGYVTFSGPQSDFTSDGVGASYRGQPIIAPFFADVDTRAEASGVVSFGSGTYLGRSAFGVTYPGVGYYSYGNNKLNSFQVILTDRRDVGMGNFDIYFNYQSIQWEAGDASGGSSGLGGKSAAAGYSNGSGVDGTYYQFPGSLVPSSLIDGGSNPLIAGTNDGVAGQYLFQVRNGAVVSPVPLPASAPMFGAAILALGLFGHGMKRKKAAVAV